MTVINMLDPCPVCGGEPHVDQVEPWPANMGPAPWSVGCYRLIPTEHFVGVNGDNRLDAIRNWSAEVEKVKAMRAAAVEQSAQEKDR
jgi:hypothetical protein